MPTTPCHVPHVTITVTPTEVNEIAGFVADSGGVLPENFQPAAWLKANRADLAIMATEAVTNVVADALEGGLIDHPLLLHRRMGSNDEECC
jgi:hypothetical protein